MIIPETDDNKIGDSVWCCRYIYVGICHVQLTFNYTTRGLKDQRIPVSEDSYARKTHGPVYGYSHIPSFLYNFIYLIFQKVMKVIGVIEEVEHT